MKVSTILDQIDLGSVALPEFQRGFVWNRDQVKGLVQSLYRRHPVGSLLVWVTETESADARGDGKLSPGYVKLLLDGQQRVTSLYGVVRGRPPAFFDGNATAFEGLYFNIEDETFEFYAPIKMKDNPLWIDVSKLMKHGPGELLAFFATSESYKGNVAEYVNRLSRLHDIATVDLHVEEVTGPDKTVDVVVDIFNCVNSGGTKLSKGDLALAKVCAGWPQAREVLKTCLTKWQGSGFDFRLEWLLRNINTVLTGEAMFSALKDVDTPAFRDGIGVTEKYVDTLLNLISSRLGLDHDRVLGGRYAFPVMSRYLHSRGGKLDDHLERDKLLYWYVHSFLWGRYAGTTETVLNQDLHLIEDPIGGLDRLIAQLRQERADLKINSEDFAGWSLGARFYPLLYLLTRTCGAKDWCSGVQLSSHLLGKMSQLHLHHVFPKAYLYKHGYDRPQVNAVANFTFLTQECNLTILDQAPEVYFPKVAEKQPGALESQWIPMDPELWKVERYPDFLAARRDLLATAANDFLNSLLAGAVPETVIGAVLGEKVTVSDGDDEEAQIQSLIKWVEGNGLPAPELMYELVDPTSGAALAILDLAWPNGVQEGLSEPAAVLLNEPAEVAEAAYQAGYRYFTDAEEFQHYVLTEILQEPATVAS